MNEKKGIMAGIFLLILLSISVASASDVAYIYRKDFKVDENIVDVFTDLGLTVDLINEANLPNNFNSYKFIFVGDERFLHENKIPIGDVPSIVSNSYHGDEWKLVDDSVFKMVRTDEPLDVHITGNGLIDVYTKAFYRQGSSVAIPYLYLRNATEHNDMAPGLYKVASTHQGNSIDLGAVIAYGEKGGYLHDNKKLNANLCFYGINAYDEGMFSSKFWTPAAKDLFIDCVNFVAIECSEDNECGVETQSNNYCSNGDVYKDVDTPQCVNANTYESYCSIDTDKKLVEECDFGCSNGVCLEPKECEDNVDNDNDGFIDEEDPGCWSDPENASTYDPKDNDESDYDIYCSLDSECGVDGYVGEQYCILNDVYQDYETHACLLPGTGLSMCSANATPVLIEVCDYGCSQGACVNECTLDTDCSDDYYSENYCSGNDVYKDLHDFGCDTGSCSETIVPEFVESCAYQCVDGACSDDRVHDIGIIDYGNSVNGLLVEYVNGTDILDSTPTLSCNDILKVKVKVENQGDFTENVTMLGDLSGNSFSMNDIENLAVNDTALRSSLSPYISLAGLNGTYTITVEANTVGDIDLSDNVVTREITVLCGAQVYECSDEIDNDNDHLIDEEDPGCWTDPNNESTYDPTDDDEYNVVECSEDTECGVDGFVGDAYCVNNDVYQDYESHICNLAGTPQSYCSMDNSSVLIDTCEYGCSEGACVNECTLDSDCGDDYVTDSYCKVNDVYVDVHNFTCDENCSESITEKLIEECAYGCSNGACIPPVIECFEDIDCDDNDAYTYDECNLAGTPSSYCSHTPVNCATDNDCGFTGFFNQEYCQFDDIYKNYQEAYCHNPGTKQSYCTINLTQTFLLDCGVDSCTPNGELFCVGDDVYQSNMCTNRGCTSGACFNNLTQENMLVEECADTCVDGACVTRECTLDSDCGDDYVTDSYCKVNDVYVDVHNFTCDENCSEDVTEKLIEVCAYGCSQGACMNECTLDSDCGDDYVTDSYCKVNDVYVDVHNFTCDENCSESITEKLIEECAYGCSKGACVNECTLDTDCSDDYYSENYCSGNDVYKDLHDFGCDAGSCSETIVPEFVEACAYQCVDGACSDDRVHDIGIIDYGNSVNGLLVEYVNGTDILDSTPTLSCNDILKVKVKVENQGDFTENVTMLGDLSGNSFSMNDIENLAVNDTALRSSLSPYISLAGLNGTYTVTVEANTVGDIDLSDNVVNREITVLCEPEVQCRLDSECGDDYYSENYCVGVDVYKDLHDAFCGDGNCSENIIPEYVDTCEYGCFDGSCLNECTLDTECDDDYYTDNYCKQDDVYKDFHDFGCTDASCSENVTEILVEVCDYGCNNGACIPPVIECFEDIDCDDGTVYTIDECNLAGTVDSYCTNTEVNCVVDNDCGFTGFFGQEVCLNDDVYKNYKTSVCENAGTKQSYCSVDLTQLFIKDCGIDSCSGEGESYCVGNDIYFSEGCTLKGCDSGACYTNVSFTDTYVETCEYGCTDGTCDNECSLDLECSDDYYSENFCRNDDVYRNFHDFGCLDGSCSENITHELVEECDYGCDDGSCIVPQCILDVDCGDDYVTDNYCKADDVYVDVHNFTCDGECSEEVTEVLVEACAQGCAQGACVNSCVEVNTISYSYDQIRSVRGKNVLGNIQSANELCYELDATMPIAYDIGIPTQLTTSETLTGYNQDTKAWQYYGQPKDKKYYSILRELHCRSVLPEEVAPQDVDSSDVVIIDWKQIDAHYAGTTTFGGHTYHPSTGSGHSDHIGVSVDTLNKVCEDFGYGKVIISSDNENYHRESDDNNYYFNGNDWIKYCTGPSCSDGAVARQAIWWMGCQRDVDPKVDDEDICEEETNECDVNLPSSKTWEGPFVIRAAINEKADDFGYTPIPIFPSSAAFNDHNTAEYFCYTQGYGKVDSYNCWSNQYGRCGYDSPHDDLLAMWDAQRNDFKVWNAKEAGNQWIAQITCSDPICSA